jgi:hypothetical protein
MSKNTTRNASLSLGIRLLTRTRPSPTAPRPKPMCGATHSSYSRARRRSSACASRSSLYAAAKPQLPLRPEAKYRSPGRHSHGFKPLSSRCSLHRGGVAMGCHQTPTTCPLRHVTHFSRCSPAQYSGRHSHTIVLLTRFCAAGGSQPALCLL